MFIQFLFLFFYLQCTVASLHFGVNKVAYKATDFNVKARPNIRGSDADYGRSY